MTTNTHPAHGPVSLDRLHQISEILSKASAQSDGGNLSYAMADAVKVIEEVLGRRNADRPPVHPTIADEKLDDETLQELIEFRRSTFEYHSKEGNEVKTIIHGVVLSAMLELQERRKAATEPVAWQWFYLKQWHVTNDPQRAKDVAESGDVDVIPLYAAQPAPVVPDELLSVMEEVLRISGRDHEAWHKARNGIASCRAAMLQAGNSPSKCSLRDGIESIRNSGIPVDVDKIQSECEAGNYPVTPWIPVSERMPEDDEFVYIWPRPDFGVELHVGQYCECHSKGDGWYAQVYEQNYGIEWHPIIVTHWMPLPAAPQQEVK